MDPLFEKMNFQPAGVSLNRPAEQTQPQTQTFSQQPPQTPSQPEAQVSSQQPPLAPSPQTPNRQVLEQQLESLIMENQKYPNSDPKYWENFTQITNLRQQVADLRLAEVEQRGNARENQQTLESALSTFRSDPDFKEISAAIKAQFNTPNGMKVMSQYSPEQVKNLTETMFKAQAYTKRNQASTLPNDNAPRGVASGGVAQYANAEDAFSAFTQDDHETFSKFGIKITPENAGNLSRFKTNDQIYRFPLRGIRPKGSLNVDWSKI